MMGCNLVEIDTDKTNLRCWRCIKCGECIYTPEDEEVLFVKCIEEGDEQ